MEGSEDPRMGRPHQPRSTASSTASECRNINVAIRFRPLRCAQPRALPLLARPGCARAVYHMLALLWHPTALAAQSCPSHWQVCVAVCNFCGSGACRIARVCLLVAHLWLLLSEKFNACVELESCCVWAGHVKASAVSATPGARCRAQLKSGRTWAAHRSFPAVPECWTHTHHLHT